MKHTILMVTTVCLMLCFSGCKKHQVARRPISQESGSFMKASVARNKILNASEEKQIKQLMKSHPEVDYISSSKGYWYSYDIKNSNDTLTPKRGDVAYFDYNVKDLKESVIYSELELKPQIYYVDKQKIMSGIREGIKKMHKNEKVTFLFPSHLGYGYHGDNNKIGINQPIICTVTLHDFKPENSLKVQPQKGSLIDQNSKLQLDSLSKNKPITNKITTKVKEITTHLPVMENIKSESKDTVK